jgi:hypothetical protein
MSLPWVLDLAWTANEEQMLQQSATVLKEAIAKLDWQVRSNISHSSTHLIVIVGIVYILPRMRGIAQD